MSVRPSRTLAGALVLGLVLCGCGKSLPGESGGKGLAPPIAPGDAQGAAGRATKNTTRLGGDDPATDAAAVALAVHPGLTASSRPELVVLVDEHDWPAALAASALASAPLHAPLLYTEGDSLPQASSQALSTMRPTGAPLLSAAQIVQIGASASPSGYRVRALRSEDPYAQAAEIERLFEAVHPGAIRRVIVVAADGPPSLAMPAAGLAAQTGAPILLVTSAGVPPATVAALARMHRPSIYAVGPSSTFDDATLVQLRRFGPVKRVVSPVGSLAGTAALGADAVGNSIAVALFTDGSFGWGVDEAGHGLVFANASRPLDAPAAALLSASGSYGPLLLLERSGPVPAVLATYLRDIQPGYSELPAYRPVHGVYNHGWLIGGEQAISAATQAELDSLLEISPRGEAAPTTASTATAPASPPSGASSTTTTPPARRP